MASNIMQRCNAFMSERVKLHAAMLALQFGYAGFHIVSRAALNMGVSKVVFPVYRNILALMLIGPCAYFLEKKERPALTLSFLIQFFLLALCGITANQGFYLLGLYYTSPTFASAIQNSVPAITFIMAAALRLEKVHISRRDGLAKIIGTVACVSGATIITLYKGPPITHLWSPNLEVTATYFKAFQGNDLSAKSENWTLGCIYLLGNCLAWSGWIGLQGFVASGIAFSVQIWCIDRGGPVFVAVYQPVQTIAVAIMASIILGEQFYLGGIIGAILIIIGLYLVLWGKSEEKRLGLLQAKLSMVPENQPDNMDQSATLIINGSNGIKPYASSSLTQPLLLDTSYKTVHIPSPSEEPQP